MAGESLTQAQLSWHGVEGDRRFAFRRVNDTGGFPWLNAGRLPSMVCYHPHTTASGEWFVQTPAGASLALRDELLRRELSAAFGEDVQLMQLNHGMFDEAPLSLITTATLNALAEQSGVSLDARRFRPNIVLETNAEAPDAARFPENDWLGKLIVFGDSAEAPAMTVTQRDVRCGMLNLDPDTAAVNPLILKTTVQANQNCAGIYGATFRAGELNVGDNVYLLDVTPTA